MRQSDDIRSGAPAGLPAGASARPHGALGRAVGKHPRVAYFALLYLAVTLAFLGMNAVMLVQGRELIWAMDAQPLYANFLVWASQAIGDMAAQAAAGAMPELPMFTYSLGYGADVPQTMGAYLQDPLNIILWLMPASMIGVSYAITTWVRLLLAATSFSAYCLARKNGHAATGVAALCYVCCGFVVFLGVLRHPKFLDWAILLPLILQGADRLFDGKRPTMLIVAFVLQFVISTYYSYMSCVCLLVYCLVKYFAAPRERSVRDFAVLVGLFVLAGAVAFCISAVFSLPQIIALRSQGRATSGAASGVELLFSLKYYAKLGVVAIGGLVSTPGLTQGPVAVIAALLFAVGGKRFDRDERRPWAIALLLCCIGVLVPYVGHVFNGMGYVTDRWMLILGFVCSYIVCLTVPKVPEFGAREWKLAGIGVGVVVADAVVLGVNQVRVGSIGLSALACPLAMAALLVVAFAAFKRTARIRGAHGAGRQARAESSQAPGGWAHARHASGGGRKVRRLSAAASALMLVSVTAMCAFYCTPLGENWAASFKDDGYVYEALTSANPTEAVEQVGDGGLYRITYPKVYGGMKNSALVHGSMAVDFYSSFYNQAVDDFRQELGISDHHMNFSYAGSDSRLAIEALTGAKYYVYRKADAWRVPYGFADTGAAVGKFRVSESAHAVPLAFTMPAVLSQAEYEALSMVERQEALLQAAVVSDKTPYAADVPTAGALDLASLDIPFEIAETHGVEVNLEEGVLHVTKRGGTVTLSCEGVPGSETYLCLRNLGFSGYSPLQMAEIEGRQPTVGTYLDQFQWSDPIQYPIDVERDGHTSSFLPVTPAHVRYGGKVNWVVNTGYSADAATEIAVTFDEAGDYAFDALQVVCQPVAPIAAAADAVAGRALDGLQLETNRMSATAVLDEDTPQVALFTVAYSPGWSVTVDGQPADVLKVDTAFLGVEVSGAGSHAIEWTYCTPGVKLGACLSIGGIIAFVALIALSYVRRKVTRRRESAQAACESAIGA